MATSVVRVKPKRDMYEVEGPQMFQFDKEGAGIEGVLLSIQNVTVKGKTTRQYTLRDDEGKVWTFLATYDIAQKLTEQHIGHFVFVRYEGEDNNVQTQGNKLRRFKVFVSRAREVTAPRGNDLHITDEDIPF